jgi:hypothetical protein
MRLIVSNAVFGSAYLTLNRPFDPCLHGRFGSIGAYPHVD